MLMPSKSHLGEAPSCPIVQCPPPTHTPKATGLPDPSPGSDCGNPSWVGPGRPSPGLPPKPLGPGYLTLREGLPAFPSLQGQAAGSLSGSTFSQTNQASQQAGDQNNKERLRNPDSGKEATLRLSRTGGGKIGPGLWVRACLAWTIFVLSGGWGLMKSQLHFTKTLSP